MARVALVCMPFYRAQASVLSLALLKALLRKKGIESDILHLNLWFAEEDFEGYGAINNDVTFHGEWVFSHLLWEDEGPMSVEEVSAALQALGGRLYPSELEGEDLGAPTNPLGLMSPERYPSMVKAFREQAGPFIERCLHDIDWSTYDVVGFTSTFQQQLASLVLAKRLKEMYPHLCIVFGGGNCDGEMGETLFQEFPFVDAVCTAEGDVVFPDFVEGYLAGRPPVCTPGFLDRRLGDRAPSGWSPRSAFTNLEALPVPDYDDYFEQLAQTSFSDAKVVLYFETSRGCWWGQKHHCTFCGVNGSGMTFRTKSPDRAMGEIQALHERWKDKILIMAATDNIMPAQYVHSLLPQLRDAKIDVELFYETKSNLGREQVALYHEAGVKHVQPGIESLSTPVLRIMKKGVTGIQNIQFLKWARQYNVEAKWNVLYAFPEETHEHYEGQVELFQRLHHLAPPMVCSSIRFDRFSPYHERAEHFGIQNLRAHPSYRSLYRGLDPEVLDRLAYCFVGEYPEQHQASLYADALHDATQEWQKAAESAALFMLEGQDKVVIMDLRRIAPDRLVVLDGLQQSLLEACASIQSRRQLHQRFEDEAGVDEALESLVERHLMLREGERFLSLPLSLDDTLPRSRTYFPPPNTWVHLGEMMALAGRRP